MLKPLPLVTFAALALLTACGTPQERCLNAAAAPWRNALKERERIATDLARGYRYETEMKTVTRYRICHDGKGGHIPCWERDTQPVTRRVPVNTAALTARDAQLAKALPALRKAAEADMAQCRIAYPEDPETPT